MNLRGKVDVQIQLEGATLSEGELVVCEVPFVECQDRQIVASALVPVSTEKGWRINVPAGATRQVWLSFRPRHCPRAH